ncbi:hypothetical protein V502_05321 [Pseudogymnoascus sp. VKM F-4520 (FW-2644)]|nr:hypothetical protein V502_05321 [Pseudogymnoascus sp. VKM F-4520 (FW-2644)]
MDAAEDDRDIKLQKLSSTFIADFELSLHPFLYRTTADGAPKIRGEKVVVRFFGAETRNLELLLAAVEEAEEGGKSSGEVERVEGEEGGGREWTWEERERKEAGDCESTVAEEAPQCGGAGYPVGDQVSGGCWEGKGCGEGAAGANFYEAGYAGAGVAGCACAVGDGVSKVIDDSGGELVILLHWRVILSGWDPDLNISDEENVAFKTVHASAIARKTIIKVLRTIAVLALRREYSSKGNEVITNEIVESTVGYLLDALADNDTPVRLAASKALSVITLKLAPDMASQVVSAALDSLTTNVLWTTLPDSTKTQDLSAVNPQEWHGLILTLSHLLYRKSPPPDSLALILHALLTGLTFERRSTSGSSVGTNVRDAACFGIWALARRYTTRELQSVATAEVGAATAHGEKSIIQILATELVVTASYDSAGNIRRGASAALQELIGRHPDIVTEGIAVVQVVDYHAVALRSRAILEVAPAAARLGDCYAEALMRALFGWRGVGSGDAKSRRTVAGGVGALVSLFGGGGGEKPWRRVQGLVGQIDGQLRNLKARAIEERHGLVLVMAAAIAALPALLDADAVKEREDLLDAVKAILRVVLWTLKSAMAATSRRPELGLEATCRLIVAACSIIKMERVLQDMKYSNSALDAAAWENILRNNEAAPIRIPDGLSNSAELSEIVKALKPRIDDSFDSLEAREIVEASGSLIDASLRLADSDTIEAAVAAATSLTLILPTDARESLIHSWALAVTDRSSRTRHPGYLFALASIFTHTESQDAICTLLLSQWQEATNIIDRVSILQCLNRARILDSHTTRFVSLIAEGLDDYTTDARGDIGSLARIEALKATTKAFDTIPCDAQSGAVVQGAGDDWFADEDLFGSLYSRTLRLAAEKLDKVRAEAQTALATLIRDPIQHTAFTSALHATRTYFRYLLDLQLPSSTPWLSTASLYSHQRWTPHLFDGYVSAADSGAEGLIRASRAALNEFCFAAPANRELVCNAGGGGGKGGGEGVGEDAEASVSGGEEGGRGCVMG